MKITVSVLDPAGVIAEKARRQHGLCRAPQGTAPAHLRDTGAASLWGLLLPAGFGGLEQGIDAAES
jgi:hypothetical protein